MMRLSPLALAIAVVLTAPLSGAWARPLGVVELFTSQGCSSCPPADKVLGELAQQGDVVALAYHINYWDYLGWQDTLGSKENTQRQYDYGKAFGSRSVYTPQAVVNGRVDVNGAHGKAIADTMKSLAAGGKGMSVDVKFDHVGDSLVIETGDGDGSVTDAHVVLVYFDRASQVVIKRGENHGHTITYWNAVKEIQPAGMWHGKAKRIELPMSDVSKKSDGGCAVLLQEVDENGLPGAIIGAAIMAMPSA